MNQNTKEPWSEEFDKKFLSARFTDKGGVDIYITTPHGGGLMRCSEDIKDFIRSTLLSQRNELVEDVVTIMVTVNPEITLVNEKTKETLEGFFIKKSDVIALINKK